MRAAVLAVSLLAACSAKLGDGGSRPNTEVDAGVPSDGTQTIVVDAAPDARPCTGGDAHATGANGDCLVFYNGPKTWLNAQAACVADGAHLAIIDSAAEETAAEAVIGTADTFIGGTDEGHEGTFAWVSGDNVSFTAWHAGEPNNGNGAYSENCIIIAGARVDKGWDDRPCAPPPANSGSYAYLCQF